mmetsp:Transcript_10432/g.34311  ORF Transcript_10432/g.34311 Transcript_10432/m.34311 type:complete len:286 (+) Transcript_10432:848-1705(+)
MVRVVHVRVHRRRPKLPNRGRPPDAVRELALVERHVRRRLVLHVPHRIVHRHRSVHGLVEVEPPRLCAPPALLGRRARRDAEAQLDCEAVSLERTELALDHALVGGDSLRRVLHGEEVGLHRGLHHRSAVRKLELRARWHQRQLIVPPHLHPCALPRVRSVCCADDLRRARGVPHELELVRELPLLLLPFRLPFRRLVCHRRKDAHRHNLRRRALRRRLGLGGARKPGVEGGLAAHRSPPAVVLPAIVFCSLILARSRRFGQRSHSRTTNLKVVGGNHTPSCVFV